MRHRATHLLHVLACAPVAAMLAASSALSAHAQTAVPAPATQPQQYVVAIDPGHGGTADNNHPDQPFDPGVIAANGLEEKDVTLDVARRLAVLLQSDRVKVVLTRSDDRYVDIGPRMQTAIDAGAQLFVSVHFNSFTDPTTGGALVLYPGDDSLPFAQAMSDALRDGLLQRYQIADNGVQSKPDLWVHATMPAVTVEGAYLTDPREAELLQQNGFRDALAAAIRSGVEAQAPQIATLKQQILAWEAAHHSLTLQVPAAAHGAVAAPSSGGSVGGTLLRWTILLALLAGLVRWRRGVGRGVGWAWAAAMAYAHRGGARGRERNPRGTRVRRRGGPQLGTHALTLATSWRPDSPLLRANPSHRRRRSAQRRQVLQRAARPAPTRRSVYDELWF
ncbi:MAG TPA: N-acetylmuramoyl-L-alanine amidase [Candidatus Angelobacter sp.]|jgi:N-acetylmuramoyl-L-alanine amidase|nr:N-acetylmuramoyl-L-alanine amidase [Candidatus Angelobacter sp.]